MAPVPDQPTVPLPSPGPATPGWSGELVLIRHAQTRCTVDGSFCGRHDPPLSPAGRRMAEQLADAPALQSVQALLSSPSVRSRDTCQPLADRLGLIVTVDARLRELDFGDWEQLRPADLAGNRRYDRWQGDPAEIPPPGGETGRAVAARVLAAARDALAGGGTVALVTHKAPIRLLLCQLFDQPLRHYRAVRPAGVASITRVSFRSGRPELLALGEVSHLPAGWRAAPDLAGAER